MNNYQTKMKLLVFFCLFTSFAFAGGGLAEDFKLNNLLSNYIESRDLYSLETLLIKYNKDRVYDKFITLYEGKLEKKFNGSLIYTAIRSNDLEVLELLLQYNYPIHSSTWSENGGPGDDVFFHFGLAIYTNNIEAAKILVKYNVPFRCSDLRALSKLSLEMLKYINTSTNIKLQNYTANAFFSQKDYTTITALSMVMDNIELLIYMLKNKIYSGNDFSGVFNYGYGYNFEYLYYSKPKYQKLFDKYGYPKPATNSIFELKSYFVKKNARGMEHPTITDEYNDFEEGAIVRAFTNETYVDSNEVEFVHIITEDNKYYWIDSENLIAINKE